MTNSSKVISGLKWTAGAKFAGQLISWAVTIVVMRLLSPSDYGLMAMASVFLAFLSLAAEVGLGPALVQKDKLDPAKLHQAFGIVLVVNLFLLVFLNLLAQPIGNFFSDDRLVPVIRALSLQFPIIALTIIPEVVLQRRLEFRQKSLIDFTSSVAGSLITLIFAFAQFGVWSLVIGTLAGSIWKAIFINCVSPYLRRPVFSSKGMRSLLSFGGNVTTMRILWFFYTQADTVIVGRVLGKETLGLYSVAMHLASLPMQRVSGILNQVAFPAFSRSQNDKHLVCAQLLQALGLISFFAFPFMWGISSTANEIILLFLGIHWKDAVLPLQLLGLIMPVRMLASFLPSVTNALGHPEIALRNVVVGCLVMPISFYFGCYWGITGVAIAWLVAFPLVAFFYLHRTLVLVGTKGAELANAILPSILGATGMYLMVLGTGSLFQNSVGLTSLFILKLIVGVATYSILTLAFNRRSLQEVGSLLAKR
jgi:teichuronic acid exporter